MMKNEKEYYEFIISEEGVLVEYVGTNSDVIIPSNIKIIGKYSFAFNQYIRTIDMPDSVIEIQDGAFEDCSELQNICLSKKLLSIGEGAFFECRKLKSIYIPASVINISPWSFTACDCLSYIHVDSQNKIFRSVNGVLFNYDCTKILAFPNLNDIEYSIPVGVLEIGESAFFRCDSIRKINIPNSINLIGKDIFDGCTGLQNIFVDDFNCFFTSLRGVLISRSFKSIVHFPAAYQLQFEIPCSVNEIIPGAFCGCRAGANLSVHKNHEFYSIHNDALMNSKHTKLISFLNVSITNYSIPDGIGIIGYGAFASPNLKSVNIPNSVYCIEDWAFDSCIALEYIRIPEKVQHIRSNMFRDCHNLKHIKLTDNLLSIGSKAFIKCFSLQRINLPKNLTQIGDYAFFACYSLEEIEIPFGITSIKKFTFAFCKKLKKIIIPLSVIAISDDAFFFCKKIVIYCNRESFAYKFAILHKLHYQLF